MESSKITEIEIINFMSIKHARLVFDDNDIINIKGYNHSGKSAILKALAVCLSNYSPRNQVNFIHHGEEYFRVIVSFSDGVNIVRDKYSNGQSLYEMYKGKEKVFSTKSGSQLLKVSEVPKVIADYIQLVESDRGMLNIQFRKDPLWLVDTKGSENYLDLSEILKTVEVSRANTLLNSDKNKLSTEVNRIESELQGVKIALEGYSDLGEDLLVLLSEKEVAVQSVLSRNDVLSRINSTIGSVSGIKVPPELIQMDSERLQRILGIRELILEIDRIPDSVEVGSVGYSKLSSINEIADTVSRLNSVLQSGIPSIDIECLSVEKVNELSQIASTIGSLSEVSSSIEEILAEDRKYKKGRDKIISLAKKEGIKFVVCNNCGTLMEVKTDG